MFCLRPRPACASFARCPVAMHPLPWLALFDVSPASAPHLCLFCSLPGGNVPTAAAGAYWCFACVRAPLVPLLLAAQWQCTLCRGGRFLMFRLRPRPTCASFARFPVAMHPLPRRALIAVSPASAPHLRLFRSLPGGSAPTAAAHGLWPRHEPETVASCRRRGKAGRRPQWARRRQPVST